MDSLADFHFIRPLWFLAALPSLWMTWLLWHRQHRSTGLESSIDQSLLPFLTTGESRRLSRLPLMGLLALWLSAVTALAGPTWERRPQPVFQDQSVVVIALDLSPSMAAEDVKPSRMVRAHLKIQDFLATRKEGLTGLIVYAGEAFVVTPLTDDTHTISNLLPTLTSGILPIPGSNVEMAVALADELVRSAGITRASLLLITDDINPDGIATLSRRFPANMRLTILGIGTDEGAPVPANGEFLKDADKGTIIIARRNSEAMKALAAANNGFYLPMQGDNSDIDFYNGHLERLFLSDKQQDDTRNSDVWYELAPALLLLILPFVALTFRRGWLLGALLCITALAGSMPPIVWASPWESLWHNAEQRAYQAYQRQEYDRAAENFNDPLWRGSAHYKQGDYQGALESFQQDDSAVGHYNRGNALANLQRFDDAIAAYDQALSLAPNLTQAKHNKQRLEELLKQRQNQQQGQGGAGDEGNPAEQSSSENGGAEREDSRAGSNNSEHGESGESGDQAGKTEENAEAGDNTGSEPGQQSADAASDTGEDSGQSSGAPGEDEHNLAKEQEAGKTINEDGDSSALTAQTDSLTTEKEQALQQWLQRIPDDPSGLLKRKFEYEFEKRKQLYQQGQWQLPENNAHNRY